jgi:hypothetical protein
MILAAKDIAAAVEFKHQSLIGVMWGKKIREAQDRQGIRFDLENDGSTDDVKEVKVGSYKDYDHKDKQYRFLIQECQAGGDWENPVLYYRVQVHPKGSTPYVDVFGSDDNCMVYIPIGGNLNLVETKASKGGKLLGPTGGSETDGEKIDKKACKEDLIAFLEKVVAIKPDKDAEYGAPVKLEFKNGKIAGELRTFLEIRQEAHASGEHHHLKLVCAVCDDVQTCRCSAPKVEVIGICDDCAQKRES